MIQKKCFVIAPLDKENSLVRDRSDKILRHVIEPACRECNYVTTRADSIDASGLITRQIIQRLLADDLVVADLSGNNPNVFYELAIRHAAGLPAIQISDTIDAIPFDVHSMRTIFLNYTDIDSVASAKTQLIRQIRGIQDTITSENPVTDALQSLGYSSPFFRRHSLEKQFEQLFEQISGQISSLKDTRSAILDIADPSLPATKHADINGIWDSSMGKVKLVALANKVIGEYQLGGPEWIGDIYGEWKRDTIVFRWTWKDDSQQGVGRWKQINNELTGHWWYAEGAPKFSDVLNNPALLNSATQGYEWRLRKEPLNRKDKGSEIESNL